MTDRELAAAAAQAAARIALQRHGDAGRVTAKDAPTDVVSEVDRAAEAAAVAVIAAERPGDGYVGEEGAEQAGARTWVIDALDGTLNYLQGLQGWCAAVAVEDEQGPLAAAVFDPVHGELFTAARGEGATRNGARMWAAGTAAGGAAAGTAAGGAAGGTGASGAAAGTAAGGAAGGTGASGAAAATAGTGAGGAPDRLEEAVIATFLHQPKRELPGVGDTLRRVLAGAGSVRITGSGTLELAYVAAGRLHGWIQPATYRWDWVPGALLVIEAGGHAVRTAADPDWCIAAATPGLLEQLRALTRSP